jgi:hypothetical protein
MLKMPQTAVCHLNITLAGKSTIRGKPRFLGGIMITAHLTKVKNGWKLTLVNGVKPLLENVITEIEFKQKREAKKFAVSQNAKPWNYV